MSYDIPGPLSLRSWIFYNQLKEEDNRYDNNNYNSMVDPTVKDTGTQNNTTKIKGAALQTTYDLQPFGLITIGLKARKKNGKRIGK